MRDFTPVREIPASPGVYCLLGYAVRGAYAAYVGIGGNLRNRVSQHLEYRNSSVTTGVSAVSLDAVQVCGCRWWTDASLENSVRRNALELVAFDVLDPVLRSRGGISHEARELSQNDEFQAWAKSFMATPSGEASFPGLMELMQEVRELRQRVQALEGGR